MTHEVNAFLEINEGERSTVSAIFEDEEWDALLRFVQYTKDIQTIQLLREGGPGKLNINYSEGAGLSYSVELPSDDKVIALLHRIRPFVLNDEKTNFFRVCNYLARRIEN